MARMAYVVKETVVEVGRSTDGYTIVVREYWDGMVTKRIGGYIEMCPNYDEAVQEAYYAKLTM